MRLLSELMLPKRTKERLMQLYSGKEYVRNVRRYKREKIITGVLSLAVSFAVAFVFWSDEALKSQTEITQLYRNEWNDGSKSITLKVHPKLLGFEDKKVELVIGERSFTDEELAEFSEKLDEVLWNEILGENESADCVTANLELVTSVEGYPFSISWKSDKPLILSGKGIIDEERLAEELSKDDLQDYVIVCLAATLSYDDYREEKIGYVKVREKEDGSVSFDESVNIRLKELDEESSKSCIWPLPRVIDGVEVSFYEDGGHKGIAVILFGAAISFLLMLSKDKHIEELAKKRQEEMRRDYPELLNKFALYYTAGMSPKSIWQLLCEEYKNRSPHVKRYVYEEMVTANRSMQEGVGELCAYDDFAKRCDIVEYRTFVNLLRQAVTKGREGFDRQLIEEMEKSRRQEIIGIRLLGEEAGTKLLVPMFIMLVIVLVIVMVPAFISFKS